MLGQVLRFSAVAALCVGVVLLIPASHAGDTVESLAANPERLREVQKLCSQDWAGTGDELCKAASQARRKRFMGSGKTRYRPQPVEMFPSLGETKKPKQGGQESTRPKAPPQPGAE